MKLTEKQLADLFINSTQANQAPVGADECLNAMPASPARLKHAESLLNNFTSAQSMKMAFGMKQWSKKVADSIQTSQKSWLGFFGMNHSFKVAVAVMAFAFMLVIPEFSQRNIATVSVNNDMTKDVISNAHFENKSDVLSKGSFDRETQTNDSLFDANFG